MKQLLNIFFFFWPEAVWVFRGFLQNTTKCLVLRKNIYEDPLKKNESLSKVLGKKSAFEGQKDLGLFRTNIFNLKVWGSFRKPHSRGFRSFKNIFKKLKFENPRKNPSLKGRSSLF